MGQHGKSRLLGHNLPSRRPTRGMRNDGPFL
jgi:hypothetical protein